MYVPKLYSNRFLFELTVIIPIDLCYYYYYYYYYYYIQYISAIWTRCQNVLTLKGTDK